MRLLQVQQGQAILQTPHCIALIEAVEGQPPRRIIRNDLVDALIPLWSAEETPRPWYVLHERMPYHLGGSDC